MVDRQPTAARYNQTKIPPITLVLAAGVLLFTFFRICVCLPRGSGLTHESGVLTGLAMDFRDGLFYRPLLGPTGYGGTRYGPLHIILQGTLMRLGIGPIPSGHIIMLSSALGLVLGLYCLLRKLNVSGKWAICFAALILTGDAGQYAVTTIRLDVLSAALNIWGLVCVVFACQPLLDEPHENDRRHRFSFLLLLTAGFFFGLAILTKITDGFAIVAVFVALLLARRVKDAITVGAVTGVVSIGGLLTLNAFSHGRMFENFQACVNCGRASLGAARWGSILYEVFIRDDWTGALLMLTALTAWLASPLQQKRSLPGVLLIATIGMTLPMYFSPGLSVNQLVDAEVAAALFLGFAITRSANQKAWTAAITILFLCAFLHFGQPGRIKASFNRRADFFRNAVISADPSGGPVLSDNALVPVLAGQRPFLLDDFTFPAVRLSRPQAQDDLYHHLETGYFGGVILRYDPTTGDRPWTLGRDFATKLQQRYELLNRTNNWDHLWMYRPRSSESATETNDAR